MNLRRASAFPNRRNQVPDVTASDTTSAPPTQTDRGAPGRTAGAASARWRVWGLALAVTALAFLLRLYHLVQSYDIHVDELSYLNIGQAVADHLQVRLYGALFFLHPPLYFFIEAAVLRLFPAPDLIAQLGVLRHINVVFGALSAALVFLIGRATVSSRAGLSAALLFALEPFAVRSNSQSLLDTTALFWVLLGWWLLIRRAGQAGQRPWPAVGAGLCFGLAFLTKDMTLFLSLLPVLLLGRGVLPRATAVRTALVTVLTYLPYPLIAFAAGDGRLFLTEKFSGVLRFLGAAKVTGFKRAGGPSLTEALLSNLPTFGVVYLLALLGLPALYVLWRRPQPQVRFLAALVSSAYVMLGFLFLIGTLEEQFFYYLAVPSMLAVSAAFWLLLQGVAARKSPVRPAALLGAGAAFFLLLLTWSGAGWLSSHLTPGDGYVRLLRAVRAQVPPGSRISTLTTESMFLLNGYTTGVWATPEALRASRAQYAVLSTRQQATGYGLASPALAHWLRTKAQVIASKPSHSYGELVLYRLPAQVTSARVTGSLTLGQRGWLFLTSDRQTDEVTTGEVSPSRYAADVMIRVGELLRQRGEALAVALVPTKTRVYAADLPADLSVSPQIEQRYGATLAALRAAGIIAPDLARVYAEAVSSPGSARLYLQQDHHWTPQGANLAAQAMASNVQGRVALGELPATRSTVRPGLPQPAAQHSLTDLLPPDLQARRPRETITPYAVIDQPAGKGAALLGDDAPGIALVGSSFSATPAFQFAPLLQHALRHEVLNAAESATGPWTPLLDYVRNDAYQEAPPRLVMWEMWENFLNNRDSGTVPFGYLLDVAANVTSCETTGAPLSFTGSGGRFVIDVGQAAQPLGDFLKMHVTAPGQTALRLQLMAGTARNAVQVPFPGDRAAHIVNVPLYALSGAATTRVVINGAPVRLDQPRLCHIPAEIVNRAYANLGNLDLLRSTNAPGLQIGGLGIIESTGHRWGLGRRTTLNFFAAADHPVLLRLRYRAPVQGQSLTAQLNGHQVYAGGLSSADDVEDVRLILNVRRGLNTLQLESPLQSGVAGVPRFVPQDARPLTVEYSEFSLSDR